jgi:2-polyprenyl-3-methyl-5-hydroxy-6-metoxy-1,4-benzoquinol methylase
MSGSVGEGVEAALRRAYRGLGALPVVGQPAKKVADAAVRPAYLGLRGRLTLMRRRYGSGAYAAVWRNTQSGYERLYGDPALIDEYLTAERLAFYDAVAEVCVALQPASVVDVGCGAGNLLAAISARSEGNVELVGIDHAPAGIARLADALPDAEGIVADLRTVDLGGRKFELVVCSEVLEHLRDPNQAVHVLGALRRPGGTIVITVPDGACDTYEGHVNFWTESTLASLLAPAGVVDVQRIGPSGDLLAIVR